MTSDYNHPFRDGKPPRSVGEIRQLLTSIRKANDPIPPGPYVKGLPQVELAAVRCAARVHKQIHVRAEPVTRDADFYRRLLLERSGEVGGLCGGFLGANIGFSLPIILGSLAAIPLATFLGLLIGCVVGTVVAQSAVIRKRLDLFCSRHAPS